MRSLILLVFIALTIGVGYLFLFSAAEPKGWSAERIADDPVGYLEATEKHLQATQDELQARRRDLRREMTEAAREVERETVARDQASAQLEAARKAYLAARDRDEWPVRVDGLVYDVQGLADRLRQIDSERAIRQARLDAAARLAELGPAELRRLDQALTENRRLEADVAGRLKDARRDATRARLESLSKELAELDATSRALTEQSELLSLDDLIETSGSNRELDAILAGESR